MFRSLAKSALEFYSHRLPYHRGKWRAIEAALSVTRVEESDRGRTFDVEREGLRWRLNTTCAVQRRLYYHGALDRYDIRELLKHVESGSVFLDIGSYFGYYACRAAQSGARVFAFEPSSANHALLAKHQRMNHLHQFQTFRLALSDRVGTARFELADGENCGRGHLSNATDVLAEEVATTTLDAFAAEHGVERIDALKLDVEGAELQVLAGGHETLARLHPTMLIELNPPCLARFGASEEQLLAAVRDLGYSTWRATAQGVARFEKLGIGEAYTNILCLPT